jgi:hypothetical protein
MRNGHDLRIIAVSPRSSRPTHRRSLAKKAEVVGIWSVTDLAEVQPAGSLFVTGEPTGAEESCARQKTVARVAVALRTRRRLSGAVARSTPVFYETA